MWSAEGAQQDMPSTGNQPSLRPWQAALPKGTAKAGFGEQEAEEDKVPRKAVAQKLAMERSRGQIFSAGMPNYIQPQDHPPQLSWCPHRLPPNDQYSHSEKRLCNMEPLQSRTPSPNHSFLFQNIRLENRPPSLSIEYVSDKPRSLRISSKTISESAPSKEDSGLTLETKESTSFREVDWNAVNNSLLFYALKLCKDDNLSDSGVDAENLASDVLCRFMDPQVSRPSWNFKKYGKPSTAGVIAFLKKVLLRSFLDHLRRPDHTRRVEQDRGQAAVEQVDDKILYRAHLVRLVENARNLARALDDAEAELYLDLLIEHYHNGSELTNQEAAKLLGLVSTDVVNIKKRIQRQLKARGGP
jgi:DNA-directed RNA polymerase specialized sigma24 family protein